MKQLSLIIGAILFSTFFYKQNLGLNLLLFSCLTIIILAIHNPSSFKKRTTILLTIAYFITAIATFFFVSSIAVIANCVLFFTLIGNIAEYKSSVYINWLNGLYTMVSGFFHRYFNRKIHGHNSDIKRKIDIIYWVKIIGIPLISIVIFVSLYKNGNPVFSDLITKIDLSFINLPWLLLAFLGYYLLYNISNPIQVNPATQLDLKTPNTLTSSGDLNVEVLNKEKQLGIVLFILLNLLITIFLCTDISYIISIQNLSAPELSQQVHSGINALIASIIFAIIIILYFFRGNLNFFEDNKTLKKLAFTWIFLNVILIVSISIKNYQYIYSFGITYKRVGVLIYLLLTFIGLITTSNKIYRIKNLWYLIRVNTQVALTILIIASAINWDKYISIFNINYAVVTDYHYLINLSNNNTFLLKSHAGFDALNGKEKSSINNKYYNYLSFLNKSNWQEMRHDNFKIPSK